MSYEYRIFYPLPQESAGDAAAAAAFSLLNLADYQQLDPNAKKPAHGDKHGAAEERSDVYLIDDTYPLMSNYGLKLRGASSSSSSSSSASSSSASAGFSLTSTASNYNLELKIRKSPSFVDEKQKKHKDQTASASSTDAPPAASGDINGAEEWKKVLRGDVSCDEASLFPRIESSIDGVVHSIKFVDKKRTNEIATEFHNYINQKLRSCFRTTGVMVPSALVRSSDAAKFPYPASLCGFNFVLVKKSRVSLSSLNGEETDVEVTFFAQSGSSVTPVTYRYRSICFEGSKDQAESAAHQKLFQHLQNKYKEQAIVAAYPQFLLTLVQKHKQ